MLGHALVLALLTIIPLDGGFNSWASDGEITISRSQPKSTSTRTAKDDSRRGRSTSTHRDYVSMPANSCFSSNLSTAAVGACMYNFVCPDRAVVSPELLAEVREQYSIGPRDASFCNDGAPQPRRSVSLREVVAEEWQQIQLPAPVIEVQPADHRTLVNLDTYTQAPQETFRHTTTLLGQQVDIRANAIMWHWDLGDGSPVISEDHPGTAFPDPTGYFHYRQPGNYTITLTIEWEAEFSAEDPKKSTRLNSSHVAISYAVFCLKKKTH